MICKVKFTPNPENPMKTGDIVYIDALIILPDGSEEHIYAQQGTEDWDALQNLNKGQIIEVEAFTREGRDGLFYRLTEEETERVLNGEWHPVNDWVDNSQDNIEEIRENILELYTFFNTELDAQDLPIQPTAENVQKLAVTAYMQNN